MAITINGTGSITGLTAGGLPDGSVTAADIASGVIPAALSNAEDGTGTDFEFNSGFGSVATAYGVRAWVNFEGTSTAAIKEDGGISSFTDVDTGKYIIGFATTMPDANYCPIMGVCNDSYAGTVLSLGQDGPTGGVYSKTTTQLQFRVSKNGGDFGVVDVNEVSIAIIR